VAAGGTSTAAFIIQRCEQCYLVVRITSAKRSCRMQPDNSARPHFGCGRQIQPGQLIHHTVIHEDEDPTQKRRLPGAFLPSEHANWRSYKIFNKNDNASHRSELFVNVEKDLYNVCGELVKQLGDWKNQSVERRRALHKDLENAILSGKSSFKSTNVTV